jgi:hypothetical protein
MAANVVTITRSQAMVEAWNAGRLGELMAAHSDTVSLIGIAPKHQADRKPSALVGRAALESRLAEVIQRRHHLELISAMETDDLISLVLQDQDGDVFTVSLGLDGDGKIARIVSVRTR